MINKLIIFIIDIYRKGISPVLGSHCRFYPSCSRYMQEAIAAHGFFKGILLGCRRLCRCQPFCEGGIDPVPKNTKGKK